MDAVAQLATLRAEMGELMARMAVALPAVEAELNDLPVSPLRKAQRNAPRHSYDLRNSRIYENYEK